MTNNILPKLVGNYKNFILIALVSVIATSCYSVSVSSYTDNEFKGKKYNKIFVYSEDENFVHRTSLEKTLVEELSSISIDAIEGSELFPPTRERDESEFQRELMKNGVDGFLKIEIVIEDRDKLISKSSEVDGKNNVTNSSNMNQPVIFKYRIKLIDVETNKTAWIGISELFNYYAVTQETSGLFFVKFSRSVIDELREKGHIE
jgi:hypothetical protein